MSKIVTISDVADHAGVSKMTVSRYFNAPHQLSLRTLNKIQEAVEALGYIPNYSARVLKTGSSNLVAVLVPNVANTFFTTILRGVEDVAVAAGYTVLMGSTDENVQKERRYIEMLISRGVRGIIMSLMIKSGS